MAMIGLMLVVVLLAGCKQGDGCMPGGFPGVGCNKPGETEAAASSSLGPFSLKVSWAASTEAAVNTTGGGYRVYYNIDADVDALNKQGVVDVPFVSGSAAPNFVVIPNLKLRAPHYYAFRVQAYSAISSGSPLSEQYIIKVPR